MTIKCKLCNKEFADRAKLRRHENRKKPCVEQIANGKNVCKYCGKSFSSYMTLYNHMKNKVCKKDKVLTAITQNSLKNNIKNSVNNNVSVDGDVKVVKFGGENLSYMTDDVYKQIIGRGFNSVEAFIEHANFHPDHPENHNIYIANIRDEYLVFFDGKKWYITDRDEKMEDIIYAKSDYLIVKFNELSHEMDPRDVAKFKKFMDNRDDDAVLKKIKNELTLQFYNNRYLPQRRRKMMEMLENKRLKGKVDEIHLKRNNKIINQVCDILESDGFKDVNQIRKLLDKLNA